MIVVLTTFKSRDGVVFDRMLLSARVWCGLGSTSNHRVSQVPHVHHAALGLFNSKSGGGRGI